MRRGAMASSHRLHVPHWLRAAPVAGAPVGSAASRAAPRGHGGGLSSCVGQPLRAAAAPHGRGGGLSGCVAQPLRPGRRGLGREARASGCRRRAPSGRILCDYACAPSSHFRTPVRAFWGARLRVRCVCSLFAERVALSSFCQWSCAPAALRRAGPPRGVAGRAACVPRFVLSAGCGATRALPPFRPFPRQRPTWTPCNVVAAAPALPANAFLTWRHIPDFSKSGETHCAPKLLKPDCSKNTFWRGPLHH